MAVAAGSFGLFGIQKKSFPKTMAYACNKDGQAIDSAEVDRNGNYSFEHLAAGTYTMRISNNHQTQIEIYDVEHSGPELRYHANITWDIEDTYASGTETGLDDADGRSVEMKKEMLSGASRSHKAIVSASSAVAATAKGISVRGSREESLDEVGYPAAPDVAISGTMRKEAMPTGSSSLKSGQMTAGFWRDLDNWSKWAETNEDAAIKGYQKTWGFHPEHRFSATFIDGAGNPIIGEKINLKNNLGEIVWTSVTDNMGHVEMFAGMFIEVTDTKATYKMQLKKGEQVFDFKVKPSSGAAEICTVPVAFEATANVDIALVVDATGSMGDEISYLQAEMLDVVTRVKQKNKCLNVRFANVFYRDNSDEYVTRKSDFSSNPVDITNFILGQNAGGGGDFPEAVDVAMETTMNDLTWSDKAISKIMFLILDAPPHEDAASLDKMQRYTQMAAAKGIKIIPITASGINQSTEFLMKYMAIATNGSYVYITDHSGIGNSHEKPTGVKENVQFLNDLMVQIITDNTTWKGCDENAEQKPEPGTVEIVSSGQWQAQFYPNPAVDHIMVKSNIIPEKITVYNLAGAVVAEVKQTAEKTRIETGNLATGIYIIHCIKGSESISCRILVMR